MNTRADPASKFKHDSQNDCKQEARFPLTVRNIPRLSVLYRKEYTGNLG